MTEIDNTPPQGALFPDFMRDHARGTVADEATATLAEVVARVAALGKKATMTITYTVLPAGSGGRTVSLVGEVTSKLPIPDPEPSIYFVGDNGALLRDDPFNRPHPGLIPKNVDPETGEIRLDGEAMANHGWYIRQRGGGEA
jgi:hypothetical protein